jgi:hypothetical protein
MNNASGERLPTQPASSTGLTIIGAGFGRTGTLSLKAALEELGFGPCYHMVELIHHPEHLERWEAAARGEPINWNDIFADYHATVDWPGCSFYEELMQAYPQAKVVLSVRDPQSWYESASSTIFNMRMNASGSRLLALLFSSMTILYPDMRHAWRINKSSPWQSMIKVDVANKEQAIAFFNQHNETLKERVAVDKLLV